MNTIPVKRCSECQQEFPLTKENFLIKKRDGKEYFHYNCTECRRAKKRKLAKDRHQRLKSDENYQARRKASYNRPGGREVAKAWYHATKAERLPKLREYARGRPFEKSVSGCNSRAKKLGIYDRVTVQEVKAMLDVYGFICHYCDEQLSLEPRGWVLEHFIPLARGGSNVVENLRFSCASCNFKKHATMPWDYLPDRFPAP